MSVDGFVGGKSLAPTGVRIPTHLAYTDSPYGLSNPNPLTAVVYSDRGKTGTLVTVLFKVQGSAVVLF